MPTINEEIAFIASNKFEIADFSIHSLDSNDAKSLANDLVKNTSLQQLILEDCKINDNQFEIIAEGLIKRNLPLQILNLNYNLLTELSIPKLKKLVEKELIKKLLIYANDGLLNKKNVDALRELAIAAIAKDILICNVNPKYIARDYPNFFAVIKPAPTDNQKQVDENKEGSLHQTIRPGSSSTF